MLTMNLLYLLVYIQAFLRAFPKLSHCNQNLKPSVLLNFHTNTAESINKNKIQFDRENHLD